MRLAFVLLALLATPALAQDEVAKARSFFEAGKRAYEMGQYKQAIAAFSESLALSPRATTTFSLAQSLRLQYFQDRDPSKLRRAIELYNRYLSDEPMGPRRGDATEHIATLEPIWQRMEDKDRQAVGGAEASTQLMVSSQIVGARARIDGKEPVELPVVVSTQPGPHKVEVEADGYFPASYEQVAVAGRLVMIDAELSPKPAIVRVDAPDGAEISLSGRVVGLAPLPPLEVPAGKYLLTVSDTGAYPVQRELSLERGGAADLPITLERTRQRYVAFGAFGLATIATGLGVMTTAVALGQESEAEALVAAQTSRALSPDEVVRYERLVGRRDGFAATAYLLFGGASALAVAGTLLYVFDTPRIESPAGALDVVPIVGPDGGGVRVSGRLP